MMEAVSLSSLDVLASEGGFHMSDEAEGSGELFDELEAVCRAFQRREVSAPEVAAVLELIESRVGMNRRQLAQHVAPALKSHPEDAALAARAAAFEAALQGVEEGARIVRNAVIGGPEGWLGSIDDGLARLHEGAERMSRLRE